MIREATEQDIPQVVEMGRHFLVDGPYKEFADNPEQATKFAQQIVKHEHIQSYVLVSEEDGQLTGVFAFMFFAHYYSGEPTAGELIWYVKPEHRPGGIALKLLLMAEKKAKEMGATRLFLTAPDEARGALFKRCGYRQLEVTFQRNL